MAVAVTVVVPTGKTLPDAGTVVTVTPGQLSFAVTVKLTTLLQVLVAAVTVISEGQIISGFSLSRTVTVKEQTGPADQVTITVVVPTLKNDPDGLL